jgi:predicted component of type VI protein secretion system
MREFDDSSKLATNLSREKLPEMISEMQRIRRAAEDQEIPACLSTLKVHQIAHMNTVINTLIAFLGGAQPETLTNGITRAGQEHDLYTLEVARLLGIPLSSTVTPAATISP